MVVTLDNDTIAKLGPSAKAQIRAVQPDERPAPKPKRKRRTAEEMRVARARAAREEAKTAAFAEDRQRRAGEREQTRKERQQRTRQQRRQQRARSARAFVGGVGVGAVAAHRQVRSTITPGSIFGTITGAALIGALVFRAPTITGLLGHMTAYWKQVIALGRPAH